MKKNKILLALVTLPMALFSLCACGSHLKGANAFMFKMTGNHFGETLYSGFEMTMKANNQKYFDKSPSEANVGAQVQMIETLMMQNVGSIVVSASGTTGYDQVLKRATAKGIKIVSADSPVSPKYRTVHVNHCDERDIGTWLARAAVLIACGVNYGEGPDWEAEQLLKQPVIDALENRTASSNKIVFGIVSSTQDSPSQNLWIKYVKEELQSSRDGINYKEKNIDTDPHIEYGDDETKKSKDKADYFIQQKVDVIIAPTTVAMAACATEIEDTMQKDPTCKVKLTGLGMPSECEGYMPESDEEDDMKSICPYMMLWDVVKLGEVAAAATLKAREGDFGKIGDSVTLTIPDEDPKTYEIIEDIGDGGPRINALPPLPFTKYNIKDWVEKL